MPADVVCLSHLRWGFVFQRPNHLMTRCARDRRVFFIEEPIFDSDVPRLEIQRIDESGLRVVVPHLRAGMREADVELAQRELLDGLLTRERVVDPMLWFYTPMALGFARHVRASTVVYDCMDELSRFRHAPPALVSRERELFERADLVFTGGHSLYEAKRAHHPRVHAFPSSVEAAHFRQARQGVVEPDDQASIPHTRVGFFGVIDERLDLELLREIAAARPDLHLVMLGPVVKIDPAELPKLPNIHWLGQKTYAELPRYLGGWDVAIMPFARNEATTFISPTKTLEYLAAGKPVVSTSIGDVVRPYGEQGLVWIADTAGDFIAAIDEAVAQRGTTAETARVLACDALLAQTSWDQTWARMDALVNEVSGRAPRPTMRERAKADVGLEEAPCSTT